MVSIYGRKNPLVMVSIYSRKRTLADKAGYQNGSIDKDSTFHGIFAWTSEKVEAIH
jgi:hypothetical protein